MIHTTRQIERLDALAPAPAPDHGPREMEHPTEINLSDPEAAADALLARAGALGREAGIYTEVQLSRKIRLERGRLPDLAEPGIAPEMVEHLVREQENELVEVSRLTLRQEMVYRLARAGLGIRCISATLGIGKQRAAARLRAAKRKIRAAVREGRYAGWYEVYVSEVNRPVYRRARERAK